MTKFLGPVTLIFLLTVNASAAISQDRLETLESLVNNATKELIGDIDESERSTRLRETNTDLAVPESPAFTVLGVTPESVIRPTSPKEIGTALLNGADSNGNLQTGLAIETAPYLLFGGNELTIKAYNDDFGRRFLAGTGLSLATTKGLDDDESVRFAAGLTFTPWDRGDPRQWSQLDSDPEKRPTRKPNELARCLGEEWTTISGKLQTAIFKNDRYTGYLFGRESEPTQEEVTASVSQALDESDKNAIKECRANFREATWNASALNFGIAPAFIGPSGNVGDLEWGGVAFYSTLGYGFEEFPGILEENAQLLLHARYHLDEQSVDPDAAETLFEQDTLTLGGQLRLALPTLSRSETVGGPDLNFLAEASYIIQNREGRPDERFFRYSIGAEHRLTEDLYLKASIGTTDGRDESDDESFVLFNLKWDLSADPTLR